MALQKQKVSIPLAEGINTKIDPNQRPIGTLENLENVVFDEPGRVKKRTGYDKLDTILLDDTLISDAQRISTYRDELVMFNNTNFFSFSEGTNRWTNKGTVSNIFPTSTSVVRNSFQQSKFDSVHVAGVNVYIWEDTRGGIRSSIVDNITGNELLSDTQISATGTKPRVEFIGDIVFYVYLDGNDLKYRTVNPTQPNTINPEVVVTSDADVAFDTGSISAKIFFCWNTTSSSIKLASIDETEVLSSVVEQSGETATSINVNSDASERVLVSYANATAAKAFIRSFNLLANIVPPTVVETISNITNTTMINVNGTDFTVLYEQSASNTYDHRIRKNTINLSAVVGVASDFKRSVGLASKQFSYNNNWYVSVIHSSELQSTTFLLNQNAEVVSKISQGVSGNLISGASLPKVSPVTSDMFLLTSQKKGRTISEENTLFSLLGLISTKLDFEADSKFDNAFLGAQLHTNGGMIQSYDGKEIVEHGFHLFPENLADAGTATTGGNISDGNYQYAAVYSWVDNQGQLHRSAPSPALNISLSGATNTQTQTITVPTLRITEKSTDVVIELYRTEATGTIFYKVTSVSSPTYNDQTVDSINIVDTISDTNLIDNEILYTTGGVLENIAPPSASIIETFQGRIFLAGLEDENQIQFSKVRNELSPVEFNDTQIINVNARGGKIVALAAMDDKLVIFKERAIFYLSGQGPNNLGEQNNFIEPELITNDVGCLSQNSIVLMPDGLMFQSQKGIYTLTRNLQIAYTGSPVEHLNNLSVKSANLVTSQNVVIFITEAQALVFNYFIQKWTTYTNHNGISATSLNGIYYYVREDNEVYKQSDTYTDNGSFIKLKLETSWLSFAGTQGYQRVYRMLMLGEYRNPHKLLFKVAYNFVDAFIQEKLIDTGDFTRDNIYGTESPYGSDSPYGGTGNSYQVRLDMKIQKCQSLKIQIEDSQDSNFGEGLQISNLLFVVGAKRGEYKPSQSRIYGTN